MAESTPAKATKEAPAPQPKGLEKFDPVKERCIRMFGGEDRFLQEASFLLRAVNDTPALQECTPNSITSVLVNIASTGLSLNPVQKLCYIIPRNTKVKTPGGADRWEKRAMVEPSYMGLMKLATDSGAVRHFEAQVVYKGDEFDFDLVDKKPRTHKPYWSIGHERGKLIGAYGFAILADGSIIPEHMGADELLKIRSKSDNAGGSIFQDWEGEMARKSLVKRLQKYVPRTEKSEAFLQAVDLDNAGFDTLPAPRPAGSPAELLPAEQDCEAIKAEVRDLIKTYKGPDKAAIKKECADFALTGVNDAGFWAGILKRLKAHQPA
jgi:recombination protein RecT